MTSQTLWGIDLGGTKIEGVVLPQDSPDKVLNRKRIPTEGHRGYSHVLDNICRLIADLELETGIQAESLGIGTPGTVDRETGLLRGCNSRHLNGRALHNDLQNMLGIPVKIENDANCFALAETCLGAVKSLQSPARIVFGIIMGTGVGGGLVVDGKIVSGTHGIAGEWGHNFLDDSGGLCYCGKTGCVETLISGPAIEKFYRDISGTELSLPDIDQLAENGDADAVKTIDHLCRYFGKAVAVLINILDPDVIIIGGGVGNLDVLYSKGLEEVSRHIFAPRLHTPIIKPRLGDSAGVYGAALLHNPDLMT